MEHNWTVTIAAMADLLIVMPPGETRNVDLFRTGTHHDTGGPANLWGT
jgi:hypothetical protein